MTDTTTANDAMPVSFAAALRVWVRVAALSFGGPAGQIAVMHRILVEEKGWIGERRFLSALNYCMLLPGPEAHELGIYIGWLMHRLKGGLAAGILFLLPGLVALSILSWIYAAFGEIGLVQGLFFGLKAAVLAVVFEALIRIANRALKSPASRWIALLAFLGIFAFALPFPLIIFAAALTGFIGCRLKPDWFGSSPRGSAKADAPKTGLVDRMLDENRPDYLVPSTPRLVQVLVIGGLIWLAPLLALLAWLGPDNVFTAIAAFNSKMAVVTFGGAYAVLAYMAQQAVDHYHWLKPGEMLVGLGLAEPTPGPLISVVDFVGTLAAYRSPGALAPALAGFLGGFLAMWATLVPPFIWIFAGGPYIEALSGNKKLEAALSAVTAAVVGVILNLAVWFALHLLFARVSTFNRFGLNLAVPDPTSLDIPALVLSLLAGIAIFRFRLGMIPTLLAASLLGIACYLVFGKT